MTLLSLSDVTASYVVGSEAIHGVSLEVADGGVTALLGANGAGKTTTLRAISRVVRSTGKILFDGKDISALRTDQVARLGIAHVPQGRGTLTGLTVLENLLTGAIMRRDQKQVSNDLDRCFHLFPRLTERRDSLAGNLSGGEQQMLAIGRALMTKPRILLLDEPSLGLAPKVTQDVFHAIAKLRADSGVAMLIVEQNASLVMDMADTAVVLESGRVALSGSAAELVGQDSIRQAYLGG